MATIHNPEKQTETLCKIRDIYRAIIALEIQLEKVHSLSLNEAMLLCSLRTNDRLSSGEIADTLKLTYSNTSKVIRSVEEKGLVRRISGDEDKRQMYFSLTEKGEQALSAINCDDFDMPVPLRMLIEEK